MKQIFIAATRQNDGKTMTSLGLFHAFQKRFNAVSYMKPVGQQYKIINDEKIDKDAVLFRQVYGLEDDHKLMSPIAVPKGFTESYIHEPIYDTLKEKLLLSHQKLSEGKDFLLMEGTGHAGVGSVFDMSNAVVAKELGTKVILVSLGGLGRAIDEIMLNKAVFELQGVELAGVIINKVRQDKYEKITPLIKKGLERLGIPVMGCIPYVDMLTKPTVGSIFEALKGEMMSECNGVRTPVEQCVIGDMVPHDALNSMSDHSLLIVPANREGLIMSAMCGSLIDQDDRSKLSGIVFTGGRHPHQKVLNMLRKMGLPMMLVQEDSFTVATEITQMLVKVQAEESEKIRKMQELVEEYVDVDRICDLL